VLIGIQGQQQVFKIGSDGYLDGGTLFGKLCKT
jgi:hypothetical protein